MNHIPDCHCNYLTSWILVSFMSVVGIVRTKSLEENLSFLHGFLHFRVSAMCLISICRLDFISSSFISEEMNQTQRCSRCGNGCQDPSSDALSSLSYLDFDNHSGGDEMKDVGEKGEEAVADEKGKQLLELRLDAGRGGEEEVTSDPNYHFYPEPLASYQDVVANKNLFMETLEKLHSTMGTKFMIPIIGGKELDLHRLFVEVASRGGFDKVVGEKRWREVTCVFKFPSTATNASFVLRKYFMSLLRHYEQIYYLRAKGWSSLPNTSLTLCTPFQSKRTVEYALPYPETQAANQKRRYTGEIAPTVPVLPINQSVVGVIDGKFEEGYLVTVTVGSTKLKGVLFHTSEQKVVQGRTGFSGFPENSSSRFTRCRRRRKKMSSVDPSHPKPNRSGYNFFFAEQHARLKVLHPGKVKEISKTIGDLWNNLTETEKAVYQERGMKDKQRYQSELAVYKGRMIGGLGISNVMPIQQRPLEPGICLQSMDSKMEVEEGDSPLGDLGESGSEDGTDSDGEKSDEESEPQTSPEQGEIAIESACKAVEFSRERGPSFELPMKNDAETRDELRLHSFSEVTDSAKAEPSTSKQ